MGREIKRKTAHRGALFAFAAVLLTGLGASSAVAQTIEAGVDATPSVMILLDTSGSMEWLQNQDEFPLCLNNPSEYNLYARACTTDFDCNPGLYCESDTGRCEFARSRYHTAVEVLTGTIDDYYPICDFREDDNDRVDQIDPSRNQGIRHSIACTRSADPTADFEDECYRTPQGDVIDPPGFDQASDGLIDLYGSIIHFGFMSFDSFEQTDTDVDGMYSYGFFGRSDSPGSTPYSCLGVGCWNLGARSPQFGVEGASVPPLDPSNDTDFRRDQINSDTQESILGVVPYWSTPIAAMLEDVLTFYTGGDSSYYSWYAANSPTPTDAGAFDYARGLIDGYEECRDRYVILITDGLPTYEVCTRRGTAGDDLTSWPSGCEGYWYKDAEYYASELLNRGITTYVVGFNIVDEFAEGDPRSARARLARIARAGSEDEDDAYVRYADSRDALQYELGDILSQIAEGTPSRTRPATTNRLAPDALGQYRFEANFTVSRASRYWNGDLNLVAYECEDGAINEEPLITSAAEAVASQATRTIYTTSPDIHSCSLTEESGRRTSLFRNTIDDLSEALNELNAEELEACVTVNVPGFLPELSACADLRNGAVGVDVRLGGEDVDTCMVELDANIVSRDPELFGAGTAAEAKVYYEWLTGSSLSEIYNLYPDALEDILPANVEYETDLEGGPGFARDRQSPLADIFHSSPAVVPAPDARYSSMQDYQDFLAQSIGGGRRVGNREPVVYVGSNDGLLHAFSIDYRDGNEFEEIWAYLPPSFQPRIGDWLSTGHEFMFDGSPFVQEVAVDRRLDGDNNVSGRWSTILVSGYRGGGRGYIALDVTDPNEPKFLWELDSALDPMLGYSFPEPAIGTVAYADCPIGTGGQGCERGVVVLAGGVPDSQQLADNPSTAIGRVLYVVDVETGEVIRRFDTVRTSATNEAPFLAPLSGSVTAFDGFGGSLVTRAFFGDREGNLYRLDMSSTDPTDWEVDLFFEPRAELSNAYDYGQVRFKPTVALGEDYRAVVVYGMGDTDDLDDISTEKNYVISLTEEPVFDASGSLQRYESTINWALRLEDNEKLTARPRVFNEVAFFATFVPDEDELCDIGGARFYGLDYDGDPESLTPIGMIASPRFSDELFYLPQDAADTDPAPADRVPYWDEGTPNSDPEGAPPIPAQTVVFSIDIVQSASCFLEEEREGAEGGTDDDSTSSNQITEYTENNYQISLGMSSYDPDGGSGGGGAVNNVTNIPLQSPPVTALPTSWSVIYE